MTRDRNVLEGRILHSPTAATRRDSPRNSIAKPVAMQCHWQHVISERHCAENGHGWAVPSSAACQVAIASPPSTPPGPPMASPHPHWHWHVRGTPSRGNRLWTGCTLIRRLHRAHRFPSSLPQPLLHSHLAVILQLAERRRQHRRATEVTDSTQHQRRLPLALTVTAGCSGHDHCQAPRRAFPQGIKRRA